VTYPVVSLLRGPADSLHLATPVASVQNPVSGADSTVSVAWPEVAEVTESGTYYVVVRLPAAAGRLGLSNREAPNGSYIAAVDDDALVPVVGELAISLLPTGVNAAIIVNEASKAESVFRTFLHGGVPNPTSRLTAIDFGLERSGPASLVVYDVSGREVRRLVDGQLGRGTHHVQWDGRDSRGHGVAAGVYLVHLRLADKDLTERVVIAK
jgi:hypothetical protein